MANRKAKQEELRQLELKIKKKNENKLDLTTSDKNAVPFRRITVQSLDFDWIFEGDNTFRLIDLLHREANDEVFNQFSIQVFLDLLWEHYFWPIFSHEFLLFVAYLLCFVVLVASPGENSYMNAMDSEQQEH